MRIIAVSTLKEFWETPGRGDAEQPLRTWVRVVKNAEWTTPADAKATFGSADVRPNGRMIFDIGGNKYRLVAKINYAAAMVFIRFIGTHHQYDRIDVDRV